MRQLRVGDPGSTGGRGNEELSPDTGLSSIIRRPRNKRSAGCAFGQTQAPGRAGDATARSASPDLLTLPVFGADVPASILLRRGGVDVATIAEALLAANILQPADWNGVLSDSISAGLHRWANEEMGAGRMENIGLTLLYSNNPVSIVNYEDEYGDGDILSEKGYGAFALALTNFDNLTALPIGERITALNTVRNGLGWAVLAVLDRALEVTIGGGTPSWARDMLSMWAEGTEVYDEAGVDRDEGDESPAYMAGGYYGAGEILSMKQFDAEVPSEATNLRMDPGLLESLWYEMNEDPECFPEWTRFAVAKAYHLGNALEDARHRFTPSGTLHGLCRVYEYDKNPMKPILLWWSKQDSIGALFDDYHNMHHEDSCLTNTLWLTKFPLDSLRDAIKSARALRFAVATAVQCDSLISLIAGPPPAPVQIFTEVRVRCTL